MHSFTFQIPIEIHLGYCCFIQTTAILYAVSDSSEMMIHCCCPRCSQTGKRLTMTPIEKHKNRDSSTTMSKDDGKSYSLE